MEPPHDQAPVRIVQWTTGNVAHEAVRAVRRAPGSELVGGYAHSADKVGRDVGELCGLDPIGVIATDDVDALLDLHPDCVIYTPLHPDVDELSRILRAGVNVVTTSAFLNGRSLGERPRATRSMPRRARAAPPSSAVG